MCTASSTSSRICRSSSSTLTASSFRASHAHSTLCLRSTLCIPSLTPRIDPYIVNSRKALQVAAAQGRGRDDADDKNGGTPYGTPAPRYTATFGSVPNPQSQMHGCTTLSIAVRNVKHVKESQIDEDKGMHVRRTTTFCPSLLLHTDAGTSHFRRLCRAQPDANGQHELHSVASRDAPAPPPHIYAVSPPQASAVRSQQQEQALMSGAVRQEWQ